MALRQGLNDLDERVVGPPATRAQVADRVAYAGSGAGVAFAVSDRLWPSVAALAVALVAVVAGLLGRRRPAS
jgi:hypothetical protein